MNMNLPAHIQAAMAAQANTAVDMTNQSGGDFVKVMYPTGTVFARLVEITEFGTQVQRYNEKTKKTPEPCPEMQLGFALYGTYNGMVGDKHVQGTYHDTETGMWAMFRPWRHTIKTFSNSTNAKLFNALNIKKDKKHWYEMLGSLWAIPMEYVVKDGKAYNNLLIEKAGLPIDMMTGQPYPIPNTPESQYRVFFWNHPTPESWESLAIEGTNDKGESKDFIRNQILKATDFAGSPLDIMLGGSVPSLTADAVPSTPTVAAPVVAEQVPTGQVDAPYDDPPFVPDTPSAPVVPSIPAVPNIPAVPSVPTV